MWRDVVDQVILSEVFKSPSRSRDELLVAIVVAANSVPASSLCEAVYSAAAIRLDPSFEVVRTGDSDQSASSDTIYFATSRLALLQPRAMTAMELKSIARDCCLALHACDRRRAADILLLLRSVQLHDSLLVRFRGQAQAYLIATEQAIPDPYVSRSLQMAGHLS